MIFFRRTLYLFLFLNLICSFVNCRNIPVPRYQQTNSQIGTKLYFFGGDLSYTDTLNPYAANISNEVWYLDLSSSFNTTILSWNKDTGMPVGYVFGTPCVSPIDNSVFFVGGRMFVPNTANISLYSSPIYVFNSNNSLWTTPNIIGFNFSFAGRNAIQPVIDANGKIFIFGGSNDTGYNNGIVTTFNDMSIFDITTMTWSTLTLSQNVPTGRICYTATLLPIGIIVYIGGDDGISSVTMNEIPIFDTKTYSWSTKVANGAFIENRLGHSAVLTKNRNIIIYGGILYNTTGTHAVPYIAELDTITWEWSIPSVSQANVSPSLAFHSAAIYGDYMIIAFGQTAANSAANINLTNSVCILDTKNYTWVTTFNPNKSIPTNNVTSNDYSINALYIGIGVGIGIIVLGIFLFGGFLIYQRRYQGSKFTSTPGKAVRK